MEFTEQRNIVRDQKDGMIVLLDPFFRTLESARFLKTKDEQWNISLFPKHKANKLEKINPEDLDEIYEIQGIKNSEDNLRRDVIMVVKHQPDDEEEHKLEFVRDMENQDVGQDKISFHINGSDESKRKKENICSDCRNILSYFDHMPIVSFKKKSSEIKKVDWSDSFDQLEREIIGYNIFQGVIERYRTQFIS